MPILQIMANFVDLNSNVNNAWLLSSLPLSSLDIQVIDFNADGKSDILFFYGSDVKVLTLNSTFNGFDLLYSYNNSILLQKQHLIGDFNGDGKTDFVVPNNYGQDSWTFFISNGVSFVTYTKAIGITYNLPVEDKVDNQYYQGGCILIFLSNPLMYQTFYNLESNYLVNDFDGDGKSDIIWQDTKNYDRREHYTLTGLCTSVYDHTNQLGNTSNNSSVYLNMGLTSMEQSFFELKNSFSIGNNGLDGITMITNINNNQNILNYSFARNNQIFSRTTTSNHQKNVLLKKITTGNGVNETITYKPLKKENNLTGAPTYNLYNTYTPIAAVVNYPNFDLQLSNSFMLVSKLEKQSKDSFKQQLFTYGGAVVNVDGLGFLGFRNSMRTDWFDDPTKIISNYSSSIDIVDTRGTNRRTYRKFGFWVNYDASWDTQPFISKTFEIPLNESYSNKVFKTIKTQIQEWNGLNNTNSFTYIWNDIYNNPTIISTNIREGNVRIRRVETNISYDNQPTATPYIIGRTVSKTETVTLNPSATTPDVSSVNEVFKYTNNLLTKIEKNATNSGLTTTFTTEENEYDPFGNIKKKKITPFNETAREINFEYSPTYGNRFLTKKIDVDLLETVYTYDNATGAMLTELLPSVSTSYPIRTTYTYDTWGKKTKVKNYLNKEVHFVYTRQDEKTLITATSDDGSATTELYDDLGRKIRTGSKTIDSNWSYTDRLYDNFDRNYKISEPYFGTTPQFWNETTFDDYGRTLQIKAATNKTTNFEYIGLTTKAIDGINNKITVKNAIGNVISMTDNGGTITYDYFANGNLKKTTFEVKETLIEQDGWGRKTKLIDPSAGEYRYEYNGFDQITKEITPKGFTDYTYSPVTGNLMTKWVKDAVTPTNTNIKSTYNYDPTTKLLGSINVLNPFDGDCDYTYVYDNYKRVSSTEENFTGSEARNFKSEILFYDAYGRPETEKNTATINGNSSTKTFYNEYLNGELFRKRENNISGTIIWQTNTRNARGQLLTAALGNGITISNTYNDYGYPTQIKHDLATTNMMQLDNTFDQERANMLTRSNNMFAWNETFGFDGLDRLTTFTNKNGSQTTQNYDDNGRIKDNFLGQYRYDPAKPYRNTALKLSPEGQLEPRLMQLQTLTYNAFKAPTTIVQATYKTSFGYNDSQDRCVMYYGNSNANKLLRPYRKYYSADGTMEIKQSTIAGVTTYDFTTYIGGDAYSAPAIFRQTNNNVATAKIYYLHRDNLGSILAISNDLGVKIEERLFDAWGSLIKLKRNGVLSALPTAANSLFLDRGYTGHEHLWEYNLINMNGRLYDPTLHRFLQPDNDIQDPSNTQNFNRYGYCLNNPLKYTDPSGENWLNDFIAGAAIVFGAVLVYTGVGAGLGYALIASGVSHFVGTGIEYAKNGGDWSAASTTAGNFFSYSVDISGSSGNDGNGGHSGGSNTNNPIEQHNYVVDWDSVATRGMGGLQMVGGVLEVVLGGAGGIATSETGIGAVVGWGIVLNGADNASTGFMQLLTGVAQNTALHKVVKATYIAAGGSESNAETAGTVADVSTIFIGGFSSYKNFADKTAGMTFNAYKAEYWAEKVKPAAKILTNKETGQTWKTYMELHHRFIPQRWEWAPNWMKNNRFNLQELNSLEHAIQDPFRARFAPRWVKDEYNLIWK
jgi:RHS repeat-associated protein